MGLDQAAYSRPPRDQLTFPFDKDHDEVKPDVIDIADWRKHNRLQGWMEDLWHQKGRPGLTGNESNPMGLSQFNCVELELDADDIKGLKEDIINLNFPETGGFFFGNDSYEDNEDGSDPYYYYKEDLKFVEVAIERLAAGHKVYYTCWW